MKKEELEKVCREALDMYPDKVNNYHLGKKGLIGLFAGEAMKRARGEADPKELFETLKKLLEK